LTQIESYAFSYSSLQSIVIPSRVDILCFGCFSWCESLSSISFESESRLTRIESRAFSYSSLQSIVIPHNVQFIADNAIPCQCQISLVDGDSPSNFDGWNSVRTSGLSLNFRRIVTFNSGLADLSGYLVDISSFSKVSDFAGFDGNSNEMYERVSDGLLMVIESMRIIDFGEDFESQDGNEIETEID
jgi:hypothetical protein